MKRSHILFGVVVLFGVLAYLIVPVLVRWQAETILSEELGKPVTIGSITLLPVSGGVFVEEVTVGDVVTIERISVTLSVLELFDNQVHITSLNVEGLVAPIELLSDAEKTSVSVDGYSLTSQTEESPQTFEVTLNEIEIEDFVSTVTIDGISHAVELERLVVDDLDAILSGALPGSQVELAANVNEAAVALSASVLVVDTNQKIDGEASVTNFDLSFLNQFLDTDVSGVLSYSGTFKVERRTASGSAFESEDLVSVRLKPTFTIEALSTSKPDLSAHNLRFDGDVEVHISGGDTIESSVNGEAHVAKAEMRDPLPNEVHFDEFSADLGLDVSLRDGEISALRIKGSPETSGLEVLPFGRISKTQVRDLELTPESVSATEIDIEGFNLTLDRDSTGKLQTTTLIQPTPQSTARPAHTQPSDMDESISQHVNIGQITLGENSTFTFRDQSVSPAFEFVLVGIEIEMRNLKSKETMTYDFSARYPDQDESDTGFTSAGAFVLLGAPVSGSATVNVNRFDLHEINVYTDADIKSGRLRMESVIEISDGVLTASNEVDVRGIRIESEDSQSDEMTIAMALSLLKDSDDHVKVTVPVTSTLDDFSVDTGDIIQTAVASATRSAAITYATFALQPYGALFLLKGVADKIAKPRFESIEFEQGSKELTPDAIAYIEKLGGLLSKRSLSVSLCGHATQMDLHYVNRERQESGQIEITAEELLGLAESRGATVRRALNDAGIDDDQLRRCRPTVLDEDVPPIVEITL